MAQDVVVVHGFKGLEKYFRFLPIKMQNQVGKFWETTTKFMMREIVRGFQQEKDPDGNHWAPNSLLTTNARKKGRKSKRGSKILQDNGILIKSNVAVQVSPTELKIENRAPYAAPNQFGAKSKITNSQAWWMVFNLFGFDPNAPWEFATTMGLSKTLGGEAMFKKAKKGSTVFSRSRARRGLSWVGWRQAVSLANALFGSTLVKPARMFLGFSKFTEDKIVDIWVNWFSKIAEEA